jgi:uncharacterized protein involved in exopolysaccharide biosynthesis
MLEGTSGTYVIRKYWQAIVLIALLSTVAAYASSYLASPSFSSSAHVLLRIHDIRYSSATGQDQGRQQTIFDSALVKTLAQTSSNLIISQTVAEQVVQDLHLDEPRPQAQALFSQIRAALKQAYKVALAYLRYGYYAEPPAHAGAVGLVQGALSAQQLKDSYTMEIKAMADEPELAAQMANSAALAFIAASRDRTSRESEQYRGSLKASVDLALKRANDADDAIRRYREANSITDLPEQLRLSANSQEAARKALLDTESQLTDSHARKDVLQQAIVGVGDTTASTTSVQTRNNTESPQTTTGTITVQADPATSTIASGRSSTTTTSDAGTTTTRNNLTTTQHSQGTTSEDHQTLAPNPIYQGLQAASIQLDSDIAGLEARRGQLQSALDRTVQSASMLPRDDAVLAGLRLESDSARSAYSSVRATYDSALVDAASQTPEGTVIDTATPSLYPDKPWRWLFALIGLLVGGLGGLAVGYAVEAWPTGGRGATAPLAAAGEAKPQLALASQIQKPTFRKGN